MKCRWMLMVAAILFAGCSARAVLTTKDVGYNPKEDARIRIYQINGNRTTMIFNDTSCKDSSINPYKRPGSNPFSRGRFHSGLPKRSLRNISIGMPHTEKSLKALARKGYFEIDSFEEVAVTAGRPVVGRGSQFDVYGCEIRGEFVPEAGKDYELEFVPASGKGEMGMYCRLVVHELRPLVNAADKRVQAQLGKAVPYQKCIL